MKTDLNLKEYIMYLHITFTKLRQNHPKNKEHILKLEKQFRKSHSWERAYEIEQLLIPLYTEDYLEIETEAKYAKIKRGCSQENREIYEKIFNRKLSRTKKEILLSRMVRELQFRHIYEFRKYLYFEETRKERSHAFIIMSVIFLFLFIFYILCNTVLAMPFSGLTIPLGLFTYFSSACFGASYALLSKTPASIEEINFETLRLTTSRGDIASRLLRALGAGLVMFVFLKSKFISQIFIPELLDPIELNYSQGQNPITLKLKEFKIGYMEIFLGVIVGACENIIPMFLKKTGKKLTMQSGQKEEKL